MQHHGGSDGQFDGEAGETEEAADGSGDGGCQRVGAAAQPRASSAVIERER